MTEISQSIRGDGLVRRYDYEAESLVVADLGPVQGSVDLVDGTAIVVVDGDHHELDVPEGASRAFMTNGIVTVEVEG
ncbi:hypothetical protein BRC75_00470 [Halobacteriales archaeon QH_7_69_31]|nr:MAG: hypothetical protein BRC75_00470 [Halobacteriales archaeon QH_7_69_31]